jgi:hypothetical protein
VPAPTISACEAHPAVPTSEANTAIPMLDLNIALSVKRVETTRRITTAILATIGVGLLRLVTPP